MDDWLPGAENVYKIGSDQQYLYKIHYPCLMISFIIMILSTVYTFGPQIYISISSHSSNSRHECIIASPLSPFRCLIGITNLTCLKLNYWSYSPHPIIPSTVFPIIISGKRFQLLEPKSLGTTLDFSLSCPYLMSKSCWLYLQNICATQMLLTNLTTLTSATIFCYLDYFSILTTWLHASILPFLYVFWYILLKIIGISYHFMSPVFISQKLKSLQWFKSKSSQDFFFLFLDIDKWILKFLWKASRTRIAKNHFWKKKVSGYTPLEFKTV